MKSSAPLSIRTIFAEDHQLVTAAFQALVSEDPGIKVIGCARTGNEAVALVREIRPDVLVMDLQLEGMHGLDALREVKAFTNVCIVSMYDDEHHVLEAMRGGAFGYVCKSAAAANLIQGIRAASRGETYFCPDAQKAVLHSKHACLGVRKLTEREAAVLKLAALGKSSKDIAVELGISRRTAESHRSNSMKKLAVKNQTELVLYALRNHIIAATLGASPGKET